MKATTLIEVLLSHAENSGDRLCVADDTSSYTYRELLDTALRAGALLKKHCPKEGERVLVECSQDAGFIVCEAAISMAGLIFVPVEHGAAPDTVSLVEKETGAALFVYDDTKSSKNRKEYKTDCPALALSELLQTDSEPLDGPSRRSLDGSAVSQILFSTGTTGKSKGIELTFSANLALGENVMCGVEMKEGNTELLPLPLSHSHALRCFYANLLKGCSVVITDGVTKVKHIFELLDKWSITSLDLSPSASMVLLKLSKGALGRYDEKLDYIQIGTAPLPEETKLRLMELLPSVRLYNFYGSTESGRSCVLDFARINKPCCIGIPAVNAQFMVTDFDRNPIKSGPDNIGLLASRGPMNMKGYWLQEQLTRETLRDGYVFTNDLGYIDDEGYVYVLGRKDDVINYKGINISPDEIEAVAVGYKDVEDCACVPVEDETSGQYPKLFVQVKKGHTLDRKDLLDYLSAHVDANKVPREIEEIDLIPRTSNGKLLRRELRNRTP